MRAACLLAALSFAATACAQAVPTGIAPKEAPPAGCSLTAKANFSIGYEPVPGKKRETAAAEAGNTNLLISLKNGVLVDGEARIGSIVANRQFQFDGPPQAGAIYTGGFSVCDNSSLAIGGTTRWWKCGSGGFFNLYDQWIGAQCDEIRIVIEYSGLVSSSASPSPSTTPASSASRTAASSLSVTPLSSINGTINSSLLSSLSAATATGLATTRGTAAATAATSVRAAPSSSVGNAAPTAYAREALGAVVGILGAAMIL